MSEREEIFIADEVGSVKEGTNGVMGPNTTNGK
jgi:hypothetical protein